MNEYISIILVLISALFVLHKSLSRTPEPEPEPKKNGYARTIHVKGNHRVFLKKNYGITVIHAPKNDCDLMTIGSGKNKSYWNIV